MADLNKLILTAADYKIFLGILAGAIYPLLTVESINMSISVEEEVIWVVGEEDAQGNKQNGRKATGKISMQVGELSAILAIEGLADATRINGATIAATAIKGGFARTFKSVNINMENIDIKAKDKQSLVSMDFTALSLA